MSEDSKEEGAEAREDFKLRRRLHPLGEVGEAEIVPKAVPPPLGARCEKCGSAMVSTLPYFSAGSGLAYRPTASDLCCQRCGHIGPADFA